MFEKRIVRLLIDGKHVLLINFARNDDRNMFETIFLQQKMKKCLSNDSLGSTFEI
jgi:hypothetical protein